MKMDTINSYDSAGVNLIIGDDASKVMFNASRETWKNRKGLPGSVTLAHDSFSAVRFIDTSMFPDAIIGMNFDGVGTKIEIAERVGDHTTIAFDLFAMVCDDAARAGGEPVIIGSILDFNRVSIKIIKQLAKGMVNASKVANIAVINGEIAELGNRVSGASDIAYNWGAGVTWLGRRERMISGNEIEPGQSIVAVREAGFRSNGLSLVRKIFLTAYGNEWHNRPFGNSTLGMAVLKPSEIYTPGIIRLTGGYHSTPTARLTGIAHITGGGIPGKLGRLLSASKCGAVLEDLFNPCDTMLECQSIAGVDDKEAYRAWNMGNGLLIITPEPDLVIKQLLIEHFEARLVGKVVSNPNIMIINNALNASNEPRLLFTLQP